MRTLGQLIVLFLFVGGMLALKDSPKGSFGRRALRWAFGISFVMALPWIVLVIMALGFRYH